MKELITEPLELQSQVETTTPKWLQNALNAFHRYFFYILISIIIGIGIGITVAKTYYETKMDESMITHAFVYKGKGYIITNQ